jgi:hypothetical protein
MLEAVSLELKETIADFQDKRNAFRITVNSYETALRPRLTSGGLPE